ncbi:MAG: hypothetical protein FRX49_06176 [Trebouxia sp. A1-2]|nr:MAG: hypothetical protein FRX49_06176 [Trebouxia sp. A1-2]
MGPRGAGAGQEEGSRMGSRDSGTAELCPDQTQRQSRSLRLETKSSMTDSEALVGSHTFLWSTQNNLGTTSTGTLDLTPQGSAACWSRYWMTKMDDAIESLSGVEEADVSRRHDRCHSRVEADDS